MAHRSMTNEIRTRRTRGIVLAGAHAWDGQALDGVLPRCLLPVALTPLICYVLRWLREAGVVETTVCANSASRCARRFLTDGSDFGVVLDYFEDWVPRGPAGCVHDAALGTDADLFVVTEGAVIPPFPLRELLQTHLRNNATLTVVLTHEADQPAGAPDLQPAGVYVFDRRALGYIPKMSYQDIKEILLPKLRQSGEAVVPYITGRPPVRVSGLDSYLAVNEYMVHEICRTREAVPGYRRMGESLVHESAHVCPDARLIGPNLIGPRTHIASEVTLVGPTAIGGGCRVDRGALVNRCVLWDGVVVGSGSMAFCVILPSGANIAAGRHVSHTLVVPARQPEDRAAEGPGASAGSPKAADTCATCDCEQTPPIVQIPAPSDRP